MGVNDTDIGAGFSVVSGTLKIELYVGKEAGPQHWAIVLGDRSDTDVQTAWNDLLDAAANATDVAGFSDDAEEIIDTLLGATDAAKFAALPTSVRTGHWQVFQAYKAEGWTL